MAGRWALVLGLLLLASAFAPRAQAQVPACTSSSAAVTGYSGAGIVADCNTLLGLKDDLRGTATLNWSAATAMASWDGEIKVSGNRVTELIVFNLSLNGSIPTGLTQLTSLTALILSHNQLTGSIPSELGQLTSLKKLYLNNNKLSGSIPPELRQLTGLTELHLDDNDLSGSIPSELGQLTSLKQLNLGGNDLSGSIPSELDQLTSLTFFILSFNKLSGSIPPWLGQLTSLTELQLQNNNWSGSIPSELGQLTSLTVFWLRNNKLSGCIPVASGKFKTNINPQQGDVKLPVCLPQPTGLGATADDGEVTLSWRAPTGTVTRYQFRRSSDGGANWGAWTAASGAATTHTVTGLTNGVTYTFQVRAVNTEINGGASAAATATPASRVQISKSMLTVPEGGMETYTVVLGYAPTAAVTVSVAKQSGGDDDLSVDPAALTFTAANWNTAQTVTVSAAGR